MRWPGRTKGKGTRRCEVGDFNGNLKRVNETNGDCRLSRRHGQVGLGKGRVEKGQGGMMRQVCAIHNRARGYMVRISGLVWAVALLSPLLINNLVMAESPVVATPPGDCSVGSAEDQIAVCSALILDKTLPAETRAQAHLARGRAHAEKGAPDQAIVDFDAALTLDPDLTPAYRYRARVWRAKGNLDRALADWDAVLARDPKSANSYAERASVRRVRREFPLAIQDYESAMAVAPQRADLHTQRGNVFWATGNTIRALIDYTTAITLDPNDPRGVINRGHLFRVTKKIKLARADYNRALKLAPKNAHALGGLARLLLEQRKIEEALAAAEKAVESAPEDPGALRIRADVLQELGLVQRAARDVRLAENKEATRTAGGSSIDDDDIFACRTYFAGIEPPPAILCPD